eukprot:scaffold126_cov315-Pavlova_lutheri.AAC.44
MVDARRVDASGSSVRGYQHSLRLQLSHGSKETFQVETGLLFTDRRMVGKELVLFAMPVPSLEQVLDLSGCLDFVAEDQGTHVFFRL